jgi:hypothetical protein
MSVFVFNIACPRCETAVRIYLGQHDYLCSNCAFQVVIEDKGENLQAFKNGEVEDLDFVESAIKDGSGTMETGLKLTFSQITGSTSTSPEMAVVEASVPEESLLDVDEFGNKTANTQIIQLTFDPAQYLNEMKGTSVPAGKSSKKKISLKKVIKYAESAKPPKPTSNQVMMRNLTICAIVVLAAVFVFFAINQK